VLLAAAYAGVRTGRVGRRGIAFSLLAMAAAGGRASDRGVQGLRFMRRSGVNLRRGAARARGGRTAERVARRAPRQQVAAGGDGVRVAGAATLAAAWAGALGLAAVHTLGWVDGARAQPLWPVVALLAVVGAIPVMLSVVGGRSAGALDNASGVAAVLLAAEELASSGAVRDDGTAARRAPVGVLLTSAEELALAGARAWVHAWARDGRPPGVALNCDGVDDRGRVAVLRVSGTPRALLAEARRAAPGARVRRMPPGVLVDAVALAQSGWSALTVSRGTWRTLGRVHTRRDTLQHLDGLGVPEAAGALARLARLLGAGRAD
jgi:acetylornithine deacetylase/succinyl-diaminopimelate desuccinylase-like protein